MNGKAQRPATELILTMRPRAALRSGRNAWVTATAPTRFTSSTPRSSPSGSGSRGPATGIPALFTRPASGAPPSARSTSARARAMEAVSVTSIWTGMTPARSSVAASSGRRTVPNTRKPRPARSRAMHATSPVEAPVTTTPGVTPPNLRPPRQRRRARPQTRVDVGERHGRRNGPRAALHGRHTDRGYGAVRPQVHHGRGPVTRALVRGDDQRPRAFLGPRALERVHALARRFGERELQRAPLAVHDPFRGASHDEAHGRLVVKSVHQQKRAAHRLIVGVDGQLDRDPRRAFCESRRREQGGRERGEGEASNPGLHGNLRLQVATEMPRGRGRFTATPAGTRCRYRRARTAPGSRPPRTRAACRGCGRESSWCAT